MKREEGREKEIMDRTWGRGTGEREKEGYEKDLGYGRGTGERE